MSLSLLERLNSLPNHLRDLIKEVESKVDEAFDTMEDDYAKGLISSEQYNNMEYLLDNIMH